MAFIFPEDKADFVAPNGITYTYKSGKWMMKSYGEELDLSPYVQQDIFDADQSRQDSMIAGEAAINETQSNQINLLETQLQLLAQAQVAGRWNYVRNISGGSIRPPASKTFYGTHKDGAENVLLNWSDIRLMMISKTDVNDTVFTFTNFQEGDKVEILATDGSSACYGTVTNQPTQEAYGNLILAVERSTGGPRDDKEYIISVYRPGAVSGDVDLDVLDGRYLIKTGDTMTGSLKLDGGGFTVNKSSGTALNIQKEGVTNLQFWTDGSAITTKTTFANDNFVTKLYVDGKIDYAVSRYLPLAGGTLTGNLTLDGGGLYTDSIIKSTRKEGYAFQVKPDDVDATAFIHTNGNAEFAKVTVKGDPASDTELTNKSYVDTKVGDYLPLTGGDMTGGINVDRESGAGLQLFKEGTSNLIAWVDGGITTTKTTFNDDQLVTKAYVDEAIGDIDIPSVDLSPYLQKSGGTMTGELKIDRGSTYNHLLLKIGGTNQIKVGSYNSNETRLQVYNGKVFKVVGYVNDTVTQLFGVSNTGTVTLGNLRTPSGEKDAVNKSYVDDRISPSFRWKCVADNGAGNLGSGEFFVASNGSVYLHPVTKDGIDLNVNSGAGLIGGMNFKQLCSVHAANGQSKYLCTWNEMSFNNSNNNYIRVNKHSIFKDNTTVVNTIYHVNIPGFTF